MKYLLKCWKCGSAADREPAYKCGKCGGILEFQYETRRGHYVIRDDNPGIFRFDCVLPFEGHPEISLGEGNTPLVRSARVERQTGVRELYFKLESSNPSASFKDRAFAVITRAAAELKTDTMVIASTGNASSAAASYAARSGKKLIALIPETTPENKVLQAMTHGAVVVKVPGVYSDAYRLCGEMAEKYGWFNVTTTFINPYAREGYKTIGYEIYEELHRVPDWIITPVGDGPVLTAIAQAFSELKSMEEINHLPRLACVQAENCSPIAGAFLNGLDKISPYTASKPTIASGINDPLLGYEDDGEYTLARIRDTGGTAVSLSEKEIEESVLILAKEGIYAEPAGAAGMMGTLKLADDGTIKRDETVVMVVTGHGLKNPLPLKVPLPPVIASSEELTAFVRLSEQKGS